jgi:hypothetical protein
VPIAALVLLAGCTGRELADYFPLTGGSQRFMRIRSRMVVGSDTTENVQTRLVEVVRGEHELPGIGRAWVVETPRESAPPLVAYFRKHDDGVTQFVLRDSGRQPLAMLFLALPLAKGLKWHSTRSRTEQMEVVSQDTITVPAGTFPDCFEVLVASPRRNSELRQWFAPDVGVVRWEQDVRWQRPDGVACELHRVAELVAYQKPPADGLPRK